MWFALLATVWFSISVVAASRSARLLGSHSANFGRLLVATVLLALWAHLFGGGWSGGGLGWFFLSGCVGFGLGDIALFLTLPRLGPRLSSLMINCLSAPFGALLEWWWLGTRLEAAQILSGAAILCGVGLALAPESHLPIPARTRALGLLFGTLAGLGQAWGAVLSRKAYAVVAEAGAMVDGGTAAYQRILGGLLIVAVPYLWQRWSGRKPPTVAATEPGPSCGWNAYRWVFLNGLAGPAVGVGFYQWALKTTPSGVVLPIVAMTPLVIIPFTYFLEGDRPSGRSLVGGVLAVLGVMGLTSSVGR